MPIRTAHYSDLAAIRQLPVQLTNRPSWGILHKHYRVLVLEARTQVYIYQRSNNVQAFMALRKLPVCECAGSYLAIVHLGLRRPFDLHQFVQRLAAQAECRAAELDCAGLLVEATDLPSKTIAYYQTIGFTLQGDRLIKPLKA